MLNNLSGWHLLIVGGALCAAALVVALVVILVIRASRRGVASADLPGRPSDQLVELAQLHNRGLLTEAEYDAKRQDIIGRL